LSVQTPVRLETGAGGLPVLVADGPVPKIGDEDVRRWRDELVEERERHWA
jgi:hypothetical protein